MFWKLVHLSKARSAARSQDWSSAATYYEKLYKSNNNDAKIIIQLAHALKEKGDLEGAQEKYTEAATKFEKDSDAQRQAGLFFLRVGKHDKARFFLERHLNTDSSAKEIHKSISVEEKVYKSHTSDNHKLVFINDKILQEENWLNPRQNQIFKYLSGSLSYKG